VWPPFCGRQWCRFTWATQNIAQKVTTSRGASRAYARGCLHLFSASGDDNQLFLDIGSPQSQPRLGFVSDGYGAGRKVCASFRARQSVSDIGTSDKLSSHFIAFAHRFAGASSDFVCCTRARGKLAGTPNGLADSVNTVGIDTGREPATSHYLDASGHTKTPQYRRKGRAGYESYTRK
jgi:hypothetical protein